VNAPGNGSSLVAGSLTDRIDRNDITLLTHHVETDCSLVYVSGNSGRQWWCRCRHRGVASDDGRLDDSQIAARGFVAAASNLRGGGMNAVWGVQSWRALAGVEPLVPLHTNHETLANDVNLQVIISKN
jgi:hypothetical protein